MIAARAQGKAILMANMWSLRTVAALLIVVSAIVPASAQPCLTGANFILPVEDDNRNDDLTWRVPFNYFGNRYAAMGGHHPGEDWNLTNAQGTNTNADLNKPVRAIANGRVATVSPLGGLGTLVVVEHEGTFTIPARSETVGTASYSYGREVVSRVFSVYLHISGVTVAEGNCVTQGSTLGRIMNPGGGPHLHFEIRHPDSNQSPNGSMVGASSNWATVGGDITGYYLDLQEMATAGLRHPREFIAANSGPPSTGLIHVNGTYHWVQNGRRYGLPLGSIIDANQAAGIAGWAWASATQVSQAQLNSYQQGPVLIAPNSGSNGLLIRGRGTTTVYMLQNGRRRGIVSAEALSWNDADWFADVIDVAPQLLDSPFTLGQGELIFGVGEGATDPAVRQAFRTAYHELLTRCGHTTWPDWPGWPGEYATCLEFPQGAVTPSFTSRVSQASGSFQTFGNDTTRLGVIQQSPRGAFGVWGAIYARWRELGHGSSCLGFPTGHQVVVDADTRRSDFEGGWITWSRSTGAIEHCETDGGGAADEIAPVVSVTSHSANQTVTACSITLEGTASDGGRGESGIESVTVNGAPASAGSIGGSGTARWSRDLTLSSGSNTVTILATDASPLRNAVQTSIALRCEPAVENGHRWRLFWQNRGNGVLSLWDMADRSITTGAAIAPSVVGDTNWHIVGRGDFNGDGQPDLVWQHQRTRLTTVWIMNGGSFVRAGLLSNNSVSDTGWAIRVVADIDNDGHVDFVWQHETAGLVVVWLMNGLTLVRGVDLAQVSDTSWRIVAAGDFDGDNRTDLLWQNTRTGVITSWLMDGTAFRFGGVLSKNVVDDPNWSIVGAQDVDGDGRTDILWQHEALGYIAVWYMDRLVFRSAHLLTPDRVPSGWRIVGAVSR